VSGEIWDWALAVYARPGLPELTLTLQDEHGFNTSLLLWAAWAGPDAETLANGVQTAVVWDETVLWPLRNVRRTLKSWRRPFDAEACEGLRQDVKAAELRAERVLMEALESLCDKDPDVDVRAALGRAAMAWNGTVPAPELDRLARLLA